jgi:phosphatidate cytidylyltransferase
MSELAKRITFALLALPLVIGLVWYGGIGLAIMLSAISGIAAWEFYRLAIGTGSKPLWGHGVIISALIPLFVWARFEGMWTPPISLALVLVLELLTVALWVRGAEGKPLEVVAITLLGILYTGCMMSYGYAIRYHPYAIETPAGGLLVLTPLLMTFGADTGALYFGRKWGKTKLMPSVSPSKTVEGAIGGLIVCVGVSLAYVKSLLAAFGHLTMSVQGAILFGVIIWWAALVGDLVESMLKRQAGVKDSSALIPGHGGALDRIDSILFTLPISFLLYNWLLIPTPGLQ